MAARRLTTRETRPRHARRRAGRYFDAAVHDPPANAMSGELYSLEVYRALRRLLRPGGVLFHYVGDPASKASGRLFKGVLQRLREAGFDAKTTPAAYGITAVAR